MLAREAVKGVFQEDAGQAKKVLAPGHLGALCRQQEYCLTYNHNSYKNQFEVTVFRLLYLHRDVVSNTSWNNFLA